MPKKTEKATTTSEEKVEKATSPRKASPKKAKKATKQAKAPAPSKRDYSIAQGLDKRLVPSSKGRRAVHAPKPFTFEVREHQKVEYDIPKGKGKKLSDIDHIASAINRRTNKDDLLRTIHGLLIGRVSKGVPVKDNLLSFSGVVYSDDKLNREKLEKKLESLRKEVLKQVAALFGINPAGTREELVEKVADWLEKPKDTGEKYDVAPKKRKRSTSRSKSPAKGRGRSKSPARKKQKKDKNAPKRPKSAYILFCQDKRPEVVKKNPKMSVTEIAAELGKLWKKASASDKKKYEAQHEKDKERYAKEMKKYKAKGK